MPYIKAEGRERLLSTSLRDLMKTPETLGPGELNFLISTLLWSVFEKNKCYQKANELLGVLSAVTMEFYRRKVAPYEDLKIEENKDIALI